MSILVAEFFLRGNSSFLFLTHEIGVFHLVKFLLSTKFWTNFARWNFSSQLVLMKLTPELVGSRRSIVLSLLL
jgi:hypothetical protein